MNFHGAITNDEGDALQGFATTYPGDERVKVELRAGRNGVVYAVPVQDVSPAEAPELPPNDELFAPPDAIRTARLDPDDFKVRPT